MLRLYMLVALYQPRPLERWSWNV